MSYIDGTLCPVPNAKKAEYIKHAEAAAVLFKEYGALALVENWGDDVPEGELNSMHTAVMRKEDETVVFSWILWPDKATRDAGWGKMMEDPRMKDMSMPFDGKRMIYGGFETIVNV